MLHHNTAVSLPRNFRCSKKMDGCRPPLVQRNCTTSEPVVDCASLVCRSSFSWWRDALCAVDKMPALSLGVAHVQDPVCGVALRVIVARDESVASHRLRAGAQLQEQLSTNGPNGYRCLIKIVQNSMASHFLGNYKAIFDATSIESVFSNSPFHFVLFHIIFSPFVN